MLPGGTVSSVFTIIYYINCLIYVYCRMMKPTNYYRINKENIFISKALITEERFIDLIAIIIDRFNHGNCIIMIMSLHMY